MAITTQGTTIEVDIDGVPTWTDIAEPRTIGDLSNTSPLIDVTHLQSLAKEYIGGIADGDEIDMTCNYVAADAGQLFLKNNQGGTHPFRVTHSDAGTDSFDGTILRAGKTGIVVDGALQYGVRIKISGAITTT